MKIRETDEQTDDVHYLLFLSFATAFSATAAASADRLGLFANVCAFLDGHLDPHSLATALALFISVVICMCMFSSYMSINLCTSRYVYIDMYLHVHMRVYTMSN